MKLIISIIVTLCVCAAGGFAQSDVGEKIVAYAESKEGKKVNRGECWDLVAEALDEAGADWVRPDKFGQKVDWKSEPVLPGDIIEFRNVKIEMSDRYQLQMPQHFAVIKAETGEKSYRIIHQNYNGKKRVSELDVDLNYMTRGKVSVYRPAY